MTDTDALTSYIYQPFGSVANTNPENAKKMCGVHVIESGTSGSIEGLTRDQARRILEIVREDVE